MTDPNQWRPFMTAESPYLYALIEIKREDWQGTEIVCPRELPGGFNIHGLFWRPVIAPRFDGP